MPHFFGRHAFCWSAGMLRLVGKTRHCWGSSLALIALAAACSGTVEHRHENDGMPDASGGTNGSGVGGASGDAGVGSVGGTNFGGSAGYSGGGVGGTFGIAGSYGCFVAGTQIATPSGTRAIEELKLGDVVLAYDEHAGRVVPRPVSATFVHPDHPVGSLPLSDGRVLRVTSNHPIYLPDQQRYADAGELRGDERLLTLAASTQTSSLIAGGFQASTADPVTVYNITVEGEHNYFADGVLVHNKSGAAGVGPGGTGGACIPAPLQNTACYPIACPDIVWPTFEHVGLNQPPGGIPEAGPADSGTADGAAVIDGGPADAAPANRESGPLDTGITPSSSMGMPVCLGRGLPNPAFLAFDVVNTLGAQPVIGLYSGDLFCSGTQIGEVWLQDHQPPPLYIETSQCLRVPQPTSRHLTLAGLNPGTHVRNARFVASCACVRRLVVSTSCGYQGGPAGFCD
jgi:hypothetical protein